MLIGVDFDNTIVCYDELFHRAAVERELIPLELHASKEQIRDHCRSVGRETDWTMLQGHVYGEAISSAPAFPGAIDFFRACRQAGIDVRIVSHRTRYPVLGPKHDLHAVAVEWLKANGFLDDGQTGLGPDQAHFEETRVGKLERISKLRCDCFIDDLPELLADDGFPMDVRRILFDPHKTSKEDLPYERAGNWHDVIELLGLR